MIPHHHDTLCHRRLEEPRGLEVAARQVAVDRDLGHPRVGALAQLALGQRAARVGRNPQTGAEVNIKASTTMKFTASSTLKAALNNT